MMKQSCNGCRILRKGCCEECIIKPCLEWINSPNAQANATLFLAKFYGRVGLLNLINAAPPHLRPVVFKSLLYESCGRIANPTFGSVGLFWTGEWAQCQAAVEAVLTGSQINVVAASHSQVTSGTEHVSQINGIRHVSIDDDVDREKGKVKKMKRTGKVITPKPAPQVGLVDSAAMWKLASSREAGGSDGDSEATVEATSPTKLSRNGGAEIDLELTLG
ncbi:hypothetical protein VNO78_09483 [Psophocarpus tetragonolobus]|uniref:LOB domain-containing protein n=1 Tax=Psophocarpus tetragonolobus TaxID=3891 RepID=A0AAN9XTK0_PSOTE